MVTENKYHSLEKDSEYNRMSWSGSPTHIISEPFYASLAEIIRELSNEITSTSPVCLEFGFGTGRILFEANKFLPMANLLGLEISPAMLNFSRNILNGSGINFTLGSVEKSPILGETADLILCINVLDRVKNTKSAIQELARIAKKGGYLLVADAFDYESPQTLIDQQLSPRELVSYFQRYGCSVVTKVNCELAKVSSTGNIRKYDETILVLFKE